MKQAKFILAIIISIILFVWLTINEIALWLDWEYSTYKEEIITTDVVEEVSEKDLLIDKVNWLVNNSSISEAIVTACMKHTEDYKLCIKNIIWVSNAESSIFKAGMYPSNNWFGWMYQWRKKKFSSVEESIYQWVAMYVKNGWEVRKTGQSWITWRYCASQCTNWVSNYNSAVNKLSLD